MQPTCQPLRDGEFTEVHFDKDGVCAITRGYIAFPSREMETNNDYDFHTDHEIDGIREASNRPSIGDICHSHPNLICVKKWLTRFVGNQEPYLIICEFEKQK